MKSIKSPVVESLHDGLIISVQANAGSPLDNPQIIAALAQSVAIPDCVALRINDPVNIRAVRQVVTLPIIGIYKIYREDGNVGITPGFELACACAEAGASIVAFDPYSLDCPGREAIEEFIHLVHSELNIPVMADVATYEEGQVAYQAGADLVGSTLSGYRIPPFADLSDPPDLALVAQLSANLPVPVIAEGRYNTPELAREALDAGAYSVVVGSAITRPEFIAETFASAIAIRRNNQG